MFVNYIGSSLAKAVRDGLIEQNPFLLLEAKEKPQKRVAEREFLTIEEIKKVMNTPCRYELVKKAFLFSCFTGLRKSTIIAIILLILRSFQRKGLYNSGLKAKSTTFANNTKIEHNGRKQYNSR